MDFEIISDIQGVQAHIQADIERVLPILSQQILKDCNYFCKQDQGGLISSSLTSSDLEHGNLIWNTVYANRQYWLPATVTDVNSHAAYMWCHKAFNKFGRDWEMLLQKLLEGGR